MAEGIGWTALILIIIVIIVIIIIIVVFSSHRNEITNKGIALTIQEGSTSGTTDTMSLDGHRLYIGRSGSPLILTLNKTSGQSKGRTVSVKNNGGTNLTLKAGTIKLDPGQLGNTVTSGQLAILVAINDSDSWLRLQ